MGTDSRFNLVDTTTTEEPATDTVRRASTPTRRVAGLFVLLLAAVATVVVPSALDPGTVGRPQAVALPLPPAIGSCVVLGTPSRVDRKLPSSVRLVSCDEPHSGEIAMTWPAGHIPSAKPAAAARGMTFHLTRSLTAAAADARCDGWISDYVGWTRYVEAHDADLWIPNPPLVVGRLLTAPAGYGLPDRHWTACVVQTPAQLYVGTVRGAADEYERGRPDAVSVCLSASHAKVAFPECTQGHTAELLARASLTQDMMVNRSVEVTLSGDQIYELCFALAVVMTGAADPTYGGRLSIVTESVWQLSARANQLAVPAGWLVPDCVVTLNGSGELVGSVVGLGDRPLPVR